MRVLGSIPPNQSACVLGVVGACLAAASAAGADTFSIPIPDPPQDGSVFMATAIGPPDGTVITGAEFRLTWVNQGFHDASIVWVNVRMPLETGVAEFAVSGADLGWGAGSGPMTGTLATTAYNGVVAGGIPNTLVTIRVGEDPENPLGFGLYGQFTSDSALVLTTEPPGSDPTGACCSGAGCQVVLQSACGGAGAFQGAGTVCTPDPCVAPPCAADFDASGAVEVGDIFAFLSAWFAQDPRADLDASGGPPTVADIFAFLSAWFVGC